MLPCSYSTRAYHSIVLEVKFFFPDNIPQQILPLKSEKNKNHIYVVLENEQKKKL